MLYYKFKFCVEYIIECEFVLFGVLWWFCEILNVWFWEICLVCVSVCVIFKIFFLIDKWDWLFKLEFFIKFVM